jgi:hypothetical protein
VGKNCGSIDVTLAAMNNIIAKGKSIMDTALFGAGSLNELGA